MSELSRLLMDAFIATAVVALVVHLLMCLFTILFGREQERPVPRTVPPPAPRPSRRILRPKTAEVRPRVLNSQTGEAFLLEDELRSLLAEGAASAIRLVGGPGAGKTTAIEHLMAVQPSDPKLRFQDDRVERIGTALARDHFVICSGESRGFDTALDFELAPWNRDDLIEYLLSAHEDVCGSVMKRLGTGSTLPYRGCPAIWRPILDTMAADAAIPDARKALSNYLQWLEPDLGKFRATGRECLDQLTADSPVENPEIKCPHDEFERMLRHAEVQFVVAAEQLAQDLQGPQLPSETYLARSFPKPLIDETAAILAEDPSALLHVMNLLKQPVKRCSLFVSLLHAAHVDWPPEFNQDPDLSFAFLDGICWPAVDLSAAIVSYAHLRKANLSQAILDTAQGPNAKLQGANLAGASMKSSEFLGADFSEADLSSLKAEDSCFEHTKFCGANLQGAELSNCGFTKANLKNANLSNANLSGACFAYADLRGARLTRANLSSANFLEVKLGDADFTGANLEGSWLKSLSFREVCLEEVNFRDADMECADLEGLHARNVNFENANLKLAAFTGSHLTNAKFSLACLRGAKLADIDWEGADLRFADLQGATFHMGSSRSGLLFTGIASEGTRTGFYTDEFEEQSFRVPEDIRKANLCGADLRDALVSKVDFYLVDLRGALYDPDQAEHFRRCRAIL